MMTKILSVIITKHIQSFILLRNWTALHFAAHSGDEAMISLLMSHGTDVTIKDKARQSLLDMAELNGKARFGISAESAQPLSNFSNPRYRTSLQNRLLSTL